ncbi:MAG: hypothetical protein DLD55_00855 [candidate division SR1 bacterium]|nr:MAG: hypothetical protein DLD55_00855 [candidate division SR1 bacterium]
MQEPIPGHGGGSLFFAQHGSFAFSHDRSDFSGLIKQISRRSLITLCSQERLQENFEAQKLVLAPEIIARLDQLPKRHRYCNPPFAR